MSTETIRYRAPMIQIGHNAADRVAQLRRVDFGLARIVSIARADEGRVVELVCERPEPSLAARGAVNVLDLALRLARTLVAVHAEGVAHGNISADTIAFPEELAGEPVLTTPAVCDPDDVSQGGDLEKLCATLLGAGEVAPDVPAVLGAPSTAAELLARLEALPAARDVPAGARLHPRERELVDAIAANPGDAALRAVYADWLEDRGDVLRARFVRDADTSWLPARELAWRRVVARSPIVGCERAGCPARWDALGSGAETRSCATCARDVVYAGTSDEVTAAGGRRGPVVPDAGVVDPARAYDRGANPMRYVKWNPPPPTWDEPEPEPQSTRERSDRLVPSGLAGRAKPIDEDT